MRTGPSAFGPVLFGPRKDDPMNVAEVMTENPRTVRVDETILDAIEVLQSMEVRHAPVVDEEGTRGHSSAVGHASNISASAGIAPSSPSLRRTARVLKKGGPRAGASTGARAGSPK